MASIDQSAGNTPIEPRIRGRRTLSLTDMFTAQSNPSTGISRCRSEPPRRPPPWEHLEHLRLGDLAEDLLINIYEYVSPQDLQRLSATCRGQRRFIQRFARKITRASVNASHERLRSEVNHIYHVDTSQCDYLEFMRRFFLQRGFSTSENVWHSATCTLASIWVARDHTLAAMVRNGRSRDQIDQCLRIEADLALIALALIKLHYNIHIRTRPLPFSYSEALALQWPEKWADRRFRSRLNDYGFTRPVLANWYCTIAGSAVPYFGIETDRQRESLHQRRLLAPLHDING